MPIIGGLSEYVLLSPTAGLCVRHVTRPTNGVGGNQINFDLLSAQNRLMTRPVHCPGPVSRRSFLQVGTLGLGGLSLVDMLRMRAEAGTANSPQGGASDPDTAVIFVWLPGGPPHMEMYDMKPNAPVEYRGEFKPIATNVPGIEVCELLP